MNLKKFIIMGIVSVSVISLTNVLLPQAQAKEEKEYVVFSPKASEDQCEDSYHCVYYNEDGILVFVIPPMGSF